MHANAWENLPTKFLERLKKIVPKEKLQSVLTSYCETKPVTFRTNTIVSNNAEVLAKLKLLRIEFEQIPWYQNAFKLMNHKDKKQISMLQEQGFIYTQSLSSMIPPILLQPKPYEIICDIAAAPGSKTTQIAMMMNNTGKIIANDKSRQRLFKLRAVLRDQQVNNTEIINLPGQVLWRKYSGYFDKVLVDVPCSLEGTFTALDSKSYQDWTPKKVKILSQTQKYLLWSALSATKPGGTIVYSTCTMEPEENEGVIDWLLQKAADLVTIEEIKIPIADTQKGLTEWKSKKYHPEVKKTLRILPSKNMEGFFVAKLRKVGSE